MSDQKNKPVLDEQTFGKLLEAAFVLQEHNRKMQALEESLESQSEQLREQELAKQALFAENESESESNEKTREDVDYTLTLAEIVEAQHQIQIRHLELDKALAVVAERLARITSASGAAIGILDDATVRYRAGAGSPALPAGTEVPLQTAVCQASIRTGQVIRTEDLDTEFLFDPEPCRKRGIRSLLAVPIYYDGQIAGALELYFARIRGFVEEDIHTCQLMAGLVTEALGRDATPALRKKSAAGERSEMLAALEKFQANVAVLPEDRSAAVANASLGAVPAGISSCWKCGGRLLAEEQFCGKCGAPRVRDGEESTMQSKLASAWHAQQANEKTVAAKPANGSSPHGDYSKHSVPPHPPEKQPRPAETTADDFLESLSLPELRQEDRPQLSHLFTASERQIALPEPLLSEPEHYLDEQGVEAPSQALIKSREDLAWTSGAKAQDLLESLAAIRTPSAFLRFWNSRRGDFYLAVAVILVVIVLGWGILSNHSGSAGDGGAVTTRSATRAKRPAPDADLSAFDRFLIALGLADPPEAPEYKGNPDTQVWVDLNTALYYCPGSDLYEKTAKGKLASQRDAQLDQFEPASRKACD
ncbi:MAG TPA: GAF domain-containing protein [Candidatus Eremiobacteraceae bacterium]|nr:GAF domain-containing protein [Candidatus Eremiobacteraceae bacterium]